MLSQETPLSHFELPLSAPRAYYVPDFVSQETETQLLDRISNHTPRTRWVSLRNRRLQEWGARPLSGSKALHEPLPDWLAPLAAQLENLKLDFDPRAVGVSFSPNQCLLNE